MHRGDILTFGGARTGTRGYIAFSSYLDVPVVMGSRSTNIKCQIGGYKGRKLEDEDYIAFRQSEDICHIIYQGVWILMNLIRKR